MNKIIIVFALLSLACQTNQSLNESDCVKIEHVGVRDGIVYTIIISKEKTDCNTIIDNPVDSLLVKNVVVQSKTYEVIEEYVMTYESKEGLPTNDDYSGFNISMISNDDKPIEYFVIGSEKYETYFKHLITELENNGEAKDLIELLESNSQN